VYVLSFDPIEFPFRQEVAITAAQEAVQYWIDIGEGRADFVE
jgi:hypothetical protein